MAKIANVALTDTFNTWRTRTNTVLDRVSQFAINNSSLYANTLTSNVAFTAKGTATVTGLFTASGRATIGTNLTVSGNTTLGAAGKTITTTGILNHTGNILISGNTTFGPNILGLVNMAGRAAIGTNLTVSGNTTLGGASKTITIGGAASTLTIGGAGHTTNTSGWFGVAGRATVSTNLFVGGNTTIGNSLTVTKAASQIVTSESTGGYASFSRKAPTGMACYDFYNINNLEVARITVSSGGWYVSTGTAATSQFVIETSGAVTVYKSVGIGNNLTVSGNTTINGTTTDKSNALSQTLTDGATINWDMFNGRVATVTLGAAGRTMAAPTNLRVGTYILRVYQDATGSRTITTWNSVFKWTAAVAPVLSTGAGKLDIITFFSDGTNLYGSYLPDMR